MLDELSRSELFSLLCAYDKYIQDANEDDRYRDGWYPVCISEFYDNEYQELREDDDEDEPEY